MVENNIPRQENADQFNIFAAGYSAISSALTRWRRSRQPGWSMSEESIRREYGGSQGLQEHLKSDTANNVR